MKLVNRFLNLFSKTHRKKLATLSILVPPGDTKDGDSAILGDLIETEDIGPLTVSIHERGLTILANGAVTRGDRFLLEFGDAIEVETLEAKRAAGDRDESDGWP